jgi:hypothetical protein
MSEKFLSELRESEVPWETRFGCDIPRTVYQPAQEHKLPPRDTRQFGFGEFRNSPSSNNRLDFPNYD